MNTQCMFIISNIITGIGKYERFTLRPLQQCNFPSHNLETLKKNLLISYDWDMFNVNIPNLN